MPTTEDPVTPLPQPTLPPFPHHPLLQVTCFLLVLGLAWLIYWFFYSQYYESTNDAYANGCLIRINSAINGSVVAFFADDTDLVTEGQLLVSLDPTNYQIAYDKEVSKLASIVLQVRQLYDTVEANRVEKHPLIDQQKAAIREAFYHLQRCSIYAPATGYVAQRTVNVGQWVTPLTNMMAVIPTDYVWVDANYKETQLTYMRIGQPATVWFDLYGSQVKYPGKVLGISMGSGSVFSLIPPQNATGNWIKIVQRLPVRIGLDPEIVKNYPIRLGLSAEVSVDITKQDLPILALVPSQKPVGTTQIFDRHFEAVDAVINQVIQENLMK